MTTNYQLPQINRVREDWIILIDEWRKSGETIKEWVERRDDMTYKQFLYWRKQLFPEEVEKGPLAEIKEKSWSAVNVELPSSFFNVYICNCRIEVPSGFDQELFREIVEVLRDED